MSDPIDLTNLRDMTDGDEELEKELFKEFLKSADHCLAMMKDNIQGDTQIWRTNAHALKGTSFNLGANHLGNLCKDAQEAFEMDASSKTKLFEEIEKEYARVQTQLKGIHADL